MANIKVDIDHTITDGSEIIFESPCDCTFVTGLNVHYPNSSGEKVRSSFVFKDAHGNDLSNTDLFAKGAYVKVILNNTHGIAYIQNADTNKYLENRFKQLEENTAKDGKSAYEYAQDGGYTGTEEDFAKKLAQENIPVEVKITDDGNGNVTLII